MSKGIFELTIDVTQLPTLQELGDYGISTMRVRMNGPAGGNPVVTLAFQYQGGSTARQLAIHFLRNWYDNETDPKELLGLIPTREV